MFLFDRLQGAIAARPYFKGRTRLLRFLAKRCHVARSEYGPLLTVRPNDATNQMSLLGSYGFELRDLIEAMPANGLYLDVGANTGVYALVAAKHLCHGEAMAFEPNPTVFADLVANIGLNGLTNVKAFNFGLGDETTLVDFEFTHSHSGATAIIQKEGPQPSSGQKATALLMAPSDIGLAERLADKHVVCKIDVEGAEFRVLAALASCGALQKIKILYVEIDSRSMVKFGDAADDLYDLMASNGFSAMTDRRGAAHYDEIFQMI